MDVNALLAEVIGETERIGIPVSKHIFPEVTLNTRAVARFGCCIWREDFCYIELSARLPAAGERAVRETLAHEVLHTCRGCRNHGERWKGYAARMNAAYGYHIARTGTWEALGLADQKPVHYLLICQNCGLEIPRTRVSNLVRHPERYRCRCGGRLALARGREERTSRPAGDDNT